jgi:hypothetical protein
VIAGRIRLVAVALAGIGALAPAIPARLAQAPPPVDTAPGIEQTAPGSRAALPLLASFDGLGYGFSGPQSTPDSPIPRNPSDNSLAVGPDHVFQIVNTQLAVFTKKGERYDTTGRVLYGPIATNTIFAGLGGECEARANGDAVVRYDQLAGRWLVVMPIFRRVTPPPPAPTDRPAPPGQLARPGQASSPGPAAAPGPPPPAPPSPARGARGARGRGRGALPPGTFGMCYAVSTTADPLGPYHRYEFERPLFPDYPRPAVWPDGYYVPTSTGDEVVQKHACVVDRARMLKGEPAAEQCVIVEGANFLNNADLEGTRLPPDGTPNIVLAAGGTQLRNDFDDDGIYVWRFHVDWKTPSNTHLTGPVKIDVAPYQYLCNGQLTNCVPQPGVDRRLDAQGDKIMARVLYRNVGPHESIVAVHSVNTRIGGGGVRWYELRMNQQREPALYQQGTYAPDAFFRWLPSPAIDRRGNIALGYSFGSHAHFPGQRMTARLTDDPKGEMTFQETILAEGEAAQTSTLRWEDYTQTAMDPDDDCTIWYVGDYLKRDAPSYTTRIGAIRVPSCQSAGVSR